MDQTASIEKIEVKERPIEPQEIMEWKEKLPQGELELIQQAQAQDQQAQNEKNSDVGQESSNNEDTNDSSGIDDGDDVDQDEDPEDYKYGTVGAVAVDMMGNVAAATSTGGERR